MEELISIPASETEVNRPFRALIFDTETTGIPKHPNAKMKVQPRIIEFGAVLVDVDCRVLEEFSILIQPEERLEPIITKITGLTDNDLAGRPLFKEVLVEVQRAFSSADLMIAHNLPFDVNMIQLELQRLGKENEFTWPAAGLCTVQEFAEFYGRRPRLIQLYEDTLGKPLAQTHRASDDCIALAEIISKKGILHDFNAAIKSSDRLQFPKGFWLN